MPTRSIFTAFILSVITAQVSAQTVPAAPGPTSDPAWRPAAPAEAPESFRRPPFPPHRLPLTPPPSRRRQVPARRASTRSSLRRPPSRAAARA